MSLKSYIKQNKSDLDDIATCVELAKSKFSLYGQKVILEAKKNGTLADFAKKIPPPKERKLLLAEGVLVKNSDIWARYVFREAYSINGKDLGFEWHNKFNRQLKYNDQCCDSCCNKVALLQGYQNVPPLNDSYEHLATQSHFVTNKPQDANVQVLYYKELLDSRPLNDNKFIKGCKTLIWLFSNGHMDRKTFSVALNELNVNNLN